MTIVGRNKQAPAVPELRSRGRSFLVSHVTRKYELAPRSYGMILRPRSVLRENFADCLSAEDGRNFIATVVSVGQSIRVDAQGV